MSSTILIVDDEQGIIQSIKRMLRFEPYQLLEASNSQQALELLQTHDVHVLITDFQMPGMNGLQLCQHVRTHSPTTFRLMLSGQVDYAELRAAWSAGDIHRFIAKPWDNVLLQLEIKEALKQHSLLQQTHHLQHLIQQQQPLLMTDQNWVIKLVNQPLCELLKRPESDLLGLNLFAQTISAMPVTLETEVTRQVEQQHTWLGLFDLLNAQDKQSVWMSISAFNHDYRVALCQAVTGQTQPDPQHEMNRYGAYNQLDQARAPKLLIIEFAADDINNDDVSALCYERIQTVCGDEFELYAPSPHVFILQLPQPLDAHYCHELMHDIQQEFSHALHFQQQTLALTPTLHIQEKPAEMTDWHEWLRAHLGIQKKAKLTIPSQGTSDHDAIQPEEEQHWVLPVFNQAGNIVALKAPLKTPHNWLAWLTQIQRHWQPLSRQPLPILIDCLHVGPESLDHFLRALKQQRQQHAIHCMIMLSEGCLISQEPQDIAWRARLHEHQCQLFITDFGRSFLNSRQIAALPVQGVSLAAEFLLQLRQQKSLAQSRRLLQRIHDQGMTIYAPSIHSTEALASAHQSHVEWLSGSMLSNEIQIEQLCWYA